jgi:hypothetical protein
MHRAIAINDGSADQFPLQKSFWGLKHVPTHKSLGEFCMAATGMFDLFG